MPGRNFALKDYEKYLGKVGEATYIDCTRRCDPARIPQVWDNLSLVLENFGPPWVVQIWTKNPKGVIELGGELLSELRRRGTTLTCQLTVTGLAGTAFEPLVPPNCSDYIPDLIELLGTGDHITWRFDPIIPGLNNLERFSNLAPFFSSLGIKRLVINFVCQPGKYPRADKRLSRLLSFWKEGLPGLDPAWKVETAQRILDIAEKFGIRVSVCAESSYLSSVVEGIGTACCGDFHWFCRLSGKSPRPTKSKGSRPGCGCAAYFDVGSYGFWQSCHRCVYCYAG